jgi:hypothetical protein
MIFAGKDGVTLLGGWKDVKSKSDGLGNLANKKPAQMMALESGFEPQPLLSAEPKPD